MDKRKGKKSNPCGKKYYEIKKKQVWKYCDVSVWVCVCVCVCVWYQGRGIERKSLAQSEIHTVYLGDKLIGILCK